MRDREINRESERDEYRKLKAYLELELYKGAPITLLPILSNILLLELSGTENTTQLKLREGRKTLSVGNNFVLTY